MLSCMYSSMTSTSSQSLLAASMAAVKFIIRSTSASSSLVTSSDSYCERAAGPCMPGHACLKRLPSPPRKYASVKRPSGCSVSRCKPCGPSSVRDMDGVLTRTSIGFWRQVGNPISLNME